MDMRDCGSGRLLFEVPLTPNSTSASLRLLGLSGGDFSSGARDADTSCDRMEPGDPLQKGSTRLSIRSRDFFGIGDSVS